MLFQGHCALPTLELGHRPLHPSLEEQHESCRSGRFPDLGEQPAGGRPNFPTSLSLGSPRQRRGALPCCVDRPPHMQEPPTLPELTVCAGLAAVLCLWDSVCCNGLSPQPTGLCVGCAATTEARESQVAQPRSEGGPHPASSWDSPHSCGGSGAGRGGPRHFFKHTNRISSKRCAGRREGQRKPSKVILCVVEQQV